MVIVSFSISHAMVVMPIYHLAPFTTAEKGHETMMALYEKVTAENAGKKIILMGDSAGGGYSLALAEGLSARGLSQPDELVLLSPWVDVTMSNPGIADFYDPFSNLIIRISLIFPYLNRVIFYNKN